MNKDDTDMRDKYRAAASIYLDLSETVSGDLTHVIETCFLGAYVYMSAFRSRFIISLNFLFVVLTEAPNAIVI